MVESKSIDEFKWWKVDILRQYCQDRGFSVVNKRKEKLVALAYTAYPQNVPTILTKDQEKLQVKYR